LLRSLQPISGSGFKSLAEGDAVEFDIVEDRGSAAENRDEGWLSHVRFTTSGGASQIEAPRLFSLWGRPLFDGRDLDGVFKAFRAGLPRNEIDRA